MQASAAFPPSSPLNLLLLRHSTPGKRQLEPRFANLIVVVKSSYDRTYQRPKTSLFLVSVVIAIFCILVVVVVVVVVVIVVVVVDIFSLSRK